MDSAIRFDLRKSRLMVLEVPRYPVVGSVAASFCAVDSSTGPRNRRDEGQCACAYDQARDGPEPGRYALTAFSLQDDDFRDKATGHRLLCSDLGCSDFGIAR